MVGRAHLNRAQNVIPAPGHRAQYRVEIGGPVACDQGDGFGLARCFAEKQNDLGRLIGRKLKLNLESAARIETCAGAIGERCHALERRWMIKCAIAADKLGTVASPGSLTSRKVGES